MNKIVALMMAGTFAVIIGLGLVAAGWRFDDLVWTGVIDRARLRVGAVTSSGLAAPGAEVTTCIRTSLLTFVLHDSALTARTTS